MRGASSLVHNRTYRARITVVGAWLPRQNSIGGVIVSRCHAPDQVFWTRSTDFQPPASHSTRCRSRPTPLTENTSKEQSTTAPERDAHASFGMRIDSLHNSHTTQPARIAGRTTTSGA